MVHLRFYGTIAQLVEHRTFNPLVQGSNPCGPTNLIGLVAQGIEQQPSKLWVAGSNPAGVANLIIK